MEVATCNIHQLQCGRVFWTRLADPSRLRVPEQVPAPASEAGGGLTSLRLRRLAHKPETAVWVCLSSSCSRSGPARRDACACQAARVRLSSGSGSERSIRGDGRECGHKGVQLPPLVALRNDVGEADALGRRANPSRQQLLRGPHIIPHTNRGGGGDGEGLRRARQSRRSRANIEAAHIGAFVVARQGAPNLRAPRKSRSCSPRSRPTTLGVSGG